MVPGVMLARSFLTCLLKGFLPYRHCGESELQGADGYGDDWDRDIHCYAAGASDGGALVQRESDGIYGERGGRERTHCCYGNA